jgi:hypothetical protein
MSAELGRIMTELGGGGRSKKYTTCPSATVFVAYLTILFVTQIIAPDDWMIMNWKECRRKWYVI